MRRVVDALARFGAALFPHILQHVQNSREAESMIQELYDRYDGDAGKAIAEVRDLRSRSGEIAERRAERDRQLAEIEAKNGD